MITSQERTMKTQIQKNGKDTLKSLSTISRTKCWETDYDGSKTIIDDSHG